MVVDDWRTLLLLKKCALGGDATKGAVRLLAVGGRACGKSSENFQTNLHFIAAF